MQVEVSGTLEAQCPPPPTRLKADSAPLRLLLVASAPLVTRGTAGAKMGEPRVVEATRPGLTGNDPAAPGQCRLLPPEAGIAGRGTRESCARGADTGRPTSDRAEAASTEALDVRCGLTYGWPPASTRLDGVSAEQGPGAPSPQHQIAGRSMLSYSTPFSAPPMSYTPCTPHQETKRNRVGVRPENNARQPYKQWPECKAEDL
eukprot:gene19037-22761_t